MDITETLSAINQEVKETLCEIFFLSNVRAAIITQPIMNAFSTMST